MRALSLSLSLCPLSLSSPFALRFTIATGLYLFLCFSSLGASARSCTRPQKDTPLHRTPAYPNVTRRLSSAFSPENRKPLCMTANRARSPTLSLRFVVVVVHRRERCGARLRDVNRALSWCTSSSRPTTLSARWLPFTGFGHHRGRTCSNFSRRSFFEYHTPAGLMSFSYARTPKQLLFRPADRVSYRRRGWASCA